VNDALVLFDIDGTLIDAGGAGRAAIHAAFGDVFGVSAEALRSTRVPFAGRTDPVIFRSIAAALGLGDGPYHRYLDALHDAYYRRLAELLERPDPRRRVLPGVRALLDALSARPRTHVGLLTGNLERGARAKLSALGLAGYFEDGGFASDSEDRREIARIAAERIARRIGAPVSPGRTVVIGDTALDVDCARANGFRCIAVGTGGADPATMGTWPCDARFADLADVGAVLAAIDADDRGGR